MVNRRLNLANAAVLVNALTVGLASTYSSTATESMKSGKLNPDDNEISWIGSSLPLGAIVGGLIAGYLANAIGRKGVMMYLSLLLVGGWLSIAYASSLTFVYIGRFLTGICCGLICVVTPMYIIEISTPEKRGNLGTGFQLFICMGIIISSTAGKFLPWDWVAICGAVLAVTALLCLLPFPESPRWLVMHNKQADAVHAVNFLYGNTNNPSVNELLNESLNIPVKGFIAPHEILHPTFYKPALYSIGLMFFQQFSGSNAILYYTVKIFKEAKSSVDPMMGNLWVALVMYFSTFLTSHIIDIIGRKKSLYISGFITCVSLNIMSVYLLLSTRDPSLKDSHGWIPLLCLIIYISGFSLGLGPVPWLMMSEMSSTRVRGLICGLGTAFSWTFVFIITKSFLQIEAAVGDFGAYWIYSVFCLLSCFFALIFLPETKGKTMEEIERYFGGGEPQIHPLPDSPNERYIDQDN
ncbi:facilitated trehalose transporter Tret1 [Trichonephila inaurata madagascariensis]|uniref:Facilitated trehalose transporter Tret1 n=1 Tax=Trichonephila inaurata madagascariensis TaxID=2747483 RepID=A0A8X6YDH2_9ARAC|nr:facilitated trehalose transporter Tret1 [Trichonephila inaurata madagascariensis]